MTGKNSQIHLMLETKLKWALEKEAENQGITLSELCRRKLGSNSLLKRIETLLEKIERKVN